MQEPEEKKKSKEEYIVDFIRVFSANEQSMEPYKDQRRDLRKNFKENGWLTSEEISIAIRAYRMLNSDIDYVDFMNSYELIRKNNK
jgi:hypothetical protein